MKSVKSNLKYDCIMSNRKIIDNVGDIQYEIHNKICRKIPIVPNDINHFVELWSDRKN